MLSRRTILAGGAAALAASPPAARAQAAPPPTILKLARRDIEVNGRTASVYGIRQPDGTFGLTTEVGKPFRVRVENGIDEPSLIHWHGLTPPWRQDGVPGISGPPIPPGGSADYDFPLRFGGTFWMHSHQGLQEQVLMTAPLIIRDQRDRADQQEIVVMLADFSFTPPEQIFAKLKNTGSMAGMGAAPAAMPKPGAMAGMTMPKGGAAAAPDLNDVKYDAFLANFRTLADPEIVKVGAGGLVLLRIINSASMSNFHIDLGKLDGELIAVDGFEIEPAFARRFPVAVAQRLDIRVTLPPGPGAYPVLALLEGERDQTGIVLRAGNAPIARAPLQAEAPSPPLTLDLERNLRALRISSIAPTTRGYGRAPLPPALSPRRRHVHHHPLRLSGPPDRLAHGATLCNSRRGEQISQEGRTMPNVYTEPRPKGRKEGEPIDDYVVEDHKDHVLKTFKTQKEAIDWAKKEGHHPLVARVRHENNKTKLDHWRSAG